MSYSCSKPPANPHTLTELVKLLRSDKEFACFFAETIVSANKGDIKSVECVEAYFQPTYDELSDLGVPESQWGSMQRCTDAGNLVLGTAKEECPDAFK